jgi:murein DD-endopeptidase MepM/ murein hydrolase activator NlpD
MRLRLDGMTLAGVALLLLFGVNIVRGWAGEGQPSAGPTNELGTPIAVMTPAVPLPQEPPAVADSAKTEIDLAWNLETALPYDEYFLTQGSHGQAYGHAAIDIAAGNGSTIKSIINGTVTGAGYDQWGNTFIQIENDIFVVLYLHGVYSLVVGDQVRAGQPIGTESNIGYTLDMAGNLCAGRNCGYHTHLNVYDKRSAMNVDPLSLIPASYP